MEEKNTILSQGNLRIHCMCIIVIVAGNLWLLKFWFTMILHSLSFTLSYNMELTLMFYVFLFYENCSWVAISKQTPWQTRYLWQVTVTGITFYITNINRSKVVCFMRSPYKKKCCHVQLLVKSGAQNWNNTKKLHELLIIPRFNFALFVSA